MVVMAARLACTWSVPIFERVPGWVSGSASDSNTLVLTSRSLRVGASVNASFHSRPHAALCSPATSSCCFITSSSSSADDGTFKFTYKVSLPSRPVTCRVSSIVAFWSASRMSPIVESLGPPTTGVRDLLSTAKN